MKISALAQEIQQRFGRRTPNHGKRQAGDLQAGTFNFPHRAVVAARFPLRNNLGLDQPRLPEQIQQIIVPHKCNSTPLQEKTFRKQQVSAAAYAFPIP